MNSQLSDHGSAPDLTSRIAGVAHSHSTIEWLLTAALGLAAASAALDRQPWPTAGFAAIGAAALLRTLRLSDRSRVWRWLVYLLLAFSIALYALRVTLRLRNSASA